ncbi:MAG: 2,3-dihydroxybenzoate---[aryl-carrier protein] ligase, partial [Solirubrobacteraceae bacterium]|nr:2,3-dihydroxybenzoate---[aryl-carrier protein] ligase [Solirubrobacteraceae bacterium]
MTIPAMLDRTVELFGDRPAMWHADRRWIFAELDAMADQVAAWLLAHDVRPGDRVAVRLPNDPAFAIWAHG